MEHWMLLCRMAVLIIITASVIIILNPKLTLLLGGDVETNPGPRPPKFPCGECGKACTDYRGAKSSILCESCDTWYHADCVGINASFLSLLGRSELPWECCRCGLPNPSSSLFDTVIMTNSSEEESTHLSSTSGNSTPTSEFPGSPLASSSPSKMQYSPCKASLRTLTINFQSIFSKREEFWSLIDATKPDVIMGCETWLKSGVGHREIFPSGYNLYRKDRKDGYGGVLIAIASCLNSHEIEIGGEAEIVAAKVCNDGKDIIFGSVYRPPSSNQAYMDTLNQSIQDLCTAYPSTAVWIGGDMNLPDINWETEQITSHQYRHSISESYLQTLACTGLEQVVNFPTRGENILDIIATNRPTLVRQCQPMPGLSDHDVIFLELEIQANKRKPIRREIFLWKKADLDGMRSNAKDWADQFVANNDTSTPVETLFAETQQSLDRLVRNHVPSKMSSSRFNQCWFDTNTKRMCRKKTRAYKKAKHISSKSDSSAKAKAKAWNRYHIIKRETQRLCRQTYNKYLVDLIDSDPGNNKRLGALIKSLRCDQTGVAPLKEGHILHCDPKRKANILNKQFSSVFGIDDDEASAMGPSPYSDMPDIEVTRVGVTKLLKNLKPHKSTGPDGISAKVLKETADQISPAVTLLFQASLRQGRIPCAWKKALVVPIYKKGCKSSPENYRPISLTAILCKVCEHIVHCAIIHHLITHGILTDSQHGFRKRRSCETQLILTINDLAKGLEDKGQFDVILLDFAKAFDKVSHQRLPLKAQHYGVRGPILQWVADFLTGRTQQVMLEGHLSNETKVTSGVPQGSVLGPLLFLIYINDLPDSINHSTSRLYADDCLLYKPIRSHQDCLKLQEDLDRLQDWERKWKMEFHPSKCQVLRVTNKRNPVVGQYAIHGHHLEEVESAKYLGVHIDRKLNFNTHVDATVKKANSVSAFLHRNLRQCNRKVKQATYFTYVRPIVEYAVTAWDPHTCKNINKIEMTQRRSARYVTGDFRRTSSVAAMLNKLQWPSLADRRLHIRLVMLYRIRYDLVDIDWQQHLRESSSRTRGHGSRFTVPRCTSQVYASSFFPRTAKDWNNLPADPADSPSLEAFKSSLRVTRQ